MSVFFTIFGPDEITMISDSQGTDDETGKVVHDAQKIWMLNRQTIAAVGGDAKIGNLLLKVAMETLHELHRYENASVSEWIDMIIKTGVEVCSGLKNQIVQDALALVQVSGVLSSGSLGSCSVSVDLSTEFPIQPQPIRPGPSFPVHIVGPSDLLPRDCEDILRSTAHRLFPHRRHLGIPQWNQIAYQAVAEVSLRSRLVDNIPQALTLRRQEDGTIEILVPDL